jgi:catechol 2,3-dioxygenase-like lactoylglutathione lyase family enzyme
MDIFLSGGEVDADDFGTARDHTGEGAKTHRPEWPRARASWRLLADRREATHAKQLRIHAEAQAMGLKNLEHYFIYARDLEASRRFYETVLGFEVGYRPPFDFQGYWLYLGGVPCVHLGTAEPSAEVEYYLGKREAKSGPNTGALDHVAFRGEDFPEFKQRLDTHGVAYRHREVPEMRLQQLFVSDPDGLTLEFNFFPPPGI